MRLQRLQIDGFGSLKGMLEFPSSGMFAFVEPNESGKTTLLSALLFGLYGMPGARDPWGVVGMQYAPWDDSAFGVQLDITTHAGQFRIQRNFGKPVRNRVLRLPHGEDVTTEFCPGRNDFIGTKLTGLSLADALKTVVVRQGVIGFQDARFTTLTDALQKMADSSGGDSTVESALGVLLGALREYPFCKVAKSARVEYELKQIAESIAQVDDSIALYHSVQAANVQRLDELVALESRLPELNREITKWNAIKWRREHQEVVQQLQIDDQLRKRIDQLEKVVAENRDAGRIDEVAIRGIQSRIAVLEAARKTLYKQVKPEFLAAEQPYLQSKKKFSDSELLVTAELLEAVKLDVKAVEALRKQEKDTRQQREILHEKVKSHGVDPVGFEASNEKWNQLTIDDHQTILTCTIRVKTFAENRSRMERDGKNMKGAIEELQQQISLRKKNKRLLLIGAIALLVGAGVTAIVSILWSGVVAFGGVVCGILWNQLRKSIMQSGSSLDEQSNLVNGLQQQLEAEQSEYRELNAELERIGKIVGIAGNADLQRALSQRIAVSELMNQWSLYQRDCDQIRSRLTECLERIQSNLRSVNIDVPLDDASDDILRDRLNELVERYRTSLVHQELEAKFLETKRRLDDNTDAIAKLEAEIVQAAKGIGAPDGLLFEDCLRWIEESIKRRILFVNAETDLQQTTLRLLADDQRKQLQMRVDGLDKLLQSDLDVDSDVDAESDVNVAIDDLTQSRDATVQRISELQIALQDALKNRTELSDLVNRRNELELHQHNTQRFQTSTTIAIDALREISQRLHKSWSSALNERASGYLKRFGSTVSELRFDVQFGVTIELQDGRILSGTDITRLSTGTRDQVYFATRLGLLDYLSPKDDPLPLILDEPFGNADDERLAAGLELLQNAAEDRQIILFSCHAARHGTWIAQSGVHVGTLPRRNAK